jgi:flagellar biosynthesis protein FlhF
MQIKRFEAKDIQEALRQVKETLGPEAIILSTQKIAKGAPLYGKGGGAKVEVVAAIDPPGGAAAASENLSPPAPGGPPAETKGSLGTGGDACLQAILSSSLSPEFLRGLAGDFRNLRKEKQAWMNGEAFQGVLRWKVMEAVEILQSEPQGKKIWAFVGPTGVGKTTTLAKVAAHFRLRFNKRIALITLDTYRIGGIEQLKTYARILRLPFEIAGDAETLKEVIGRHQDCDLLLLDTAGRNPHRRDQLEEMKGVLSADPRVENHLVLSATTKDADLAAIVQQFAVLPIRSYVFTKIDETEEYTSLFNQLLRYKRPLSYLTNGQKVPEDIEPASKSRIASLVLNSLKWN